MAQGTKDVSTDLQKRTDIQDADQLLMVNPVTKEVQYVEVSQIKAVTGVTIPDYSFTNEFDI